MRRPKGAGLSRSPAVSNIADAWGFAHLPRPPPRRRRPRRRIGRALRPDLSLDRLHESFWIVHSSGLDDEPRLTRPTDVRERIAANDDEIRPLPGLDRPKPIAEPDGARAVDRRDAKHRGVWNSRKRKRQQLAVHRERREELAPARMIGAERDEIAAAGVIERFDLLSLRPIDVLELLVDLPRRTRVDDRAHVRREETSSRRRNT